MTTTNTFPAIVLNRCSTFGEGGITVTSNESEITLTSYESINDIPELPVAEFRLTHSQASYLAALLTNLATEA